MADLMKVNELYEAVFGMGCGFRFNAYFLAFCMGQICFLCSLRFMMFINLPIRIEIGHICLTIFEKPLNFMNLMKFYEAGQFKRIFELTRSGFGNFMNMDEGRTSLKFIDQAPLSRIAATSPQIRLESDLGGEEMI